MTIYEAIDLTCLRDCLVVSWGATVFEGEVGRSVGGCEWTKADPYFMWPFSCFACGHFHVYTRATWSPVLWGLCTRCGVEFCITCEGHESSERLS